MHVHVAPKPAIEILDVKKNQKGGSLIASFKICYKNFGHEFICPGDFRYFEKGTNSWVGFPSKKVGEDKFETDGGFRESGVQKRFLDQVKDTFQEYMKANPDLTPPPVVTEDDEIPF